VSRLEPSFTWIQQTGDARQIIPALVETLYFVGLAKDSDAAGGELAEPSALVKRSLAMQREDN